jgi:patatin-related protein
VAERQGSAFEIRVGLVMYGGLALAVYMNGVVQELLEIVRASQRGEAGKSEYWPLLRDAGADFVIDVIAGTSAGGLNGLVLAKALATGSDEMKGMSELWRNEAQVDRLVQTDDAKAIFSGEIMEQNLQAIMKRMSETASRELADQVKVLDLFVTATDLRGREVVHKELFSRKTIQRRNQHLFHFKKRTLRGDEPTLRIEGRKAGRSYYQNDFLSDKEAEGYARDRLLALVGRATSAFPSAFPPQRIGRDEAQAANLVHLLPDSERQEFWFSDGGILMNKPFEPVVRTIFQRSADKPVERVLLWVDPDPPAEKKEKESGEPHLLQVLSALPGVLTNEDVVSYLEQIEQQNRYRKQVTEGFEVFEQRLRDAASSADEGQAPTESACEAAGPALAGYRSLRKLRMLADLRNGFSAALRGASGSEKMVEELVKGIAAETKQERLDLWDCQFQVRRLQYMLLQLDQHVAEAVRMAKDHAAALPSEQANNEKYRELLLATDQKRIRDRQHVVTQVQTYLWDALEDWRNARWVIANARTQDDDPKIAGQMRALVERWGTRSTAARELREAVLDYLKWVDKRARAEVTKALDVLCTCDDQGGRPLDPGLGERLREVWDRFENRDILLLPMTQDGKVAEWDQIDPVMMAPGPTPKVNRPGHEKLASEIAGHFGGFFEPRWRSNDIMWGRLETAELLCGLVVKEAEKHLSPEVMAELVRTSERVLESRMRKILQEEQQSLDGVKLGALVAKARLDATAAAQSAFAEAAVANAGLAGTGPQWTPVANFWRGLTLQFAEPPNLTVLLENAPADVLWLYLTRFHSVGQEGLGAVRKSVLINGFLHGLDNLMTALRRDTTQLPVVLRWVAGALVGILKPAKWFFRVVLPWQGPLGLPAWMCGIAGALLLIVHFTGVAQLAPALVRGATTLLGIGALWLVLSRVGKRVLGAALGVLLTAGVAWALVLGMLKGAPHEVLGIDPGWGWAFGGLFATATLLMALFGGLPGGSPRAEGIIRFELAGSLSRAHALIEDWEKVRKGARQRAAFQVGADFLYIAGYAPLLALIVGLWATGLPDGSWLQRAAYLIAWSQLLAGLLDAVENVGLMQVLAETRNEMWPRLARYAAIAKFTLVGLAVPLVLLWLGPVVWGWAGPAVTVLAGKLWP